MERAGFRLGADGIFTRGDQRLSVRILTASADPSRIMIQELVQDQLKRAGVEARPENTPFTALPTELTRGNFDLECDVANCAGGPSARAWYVIRARCVQR